MRIPHPFAQSARYLSTLARYQFIAQYQLGLPHHSADALSRCSCNCETNMPLCPQYGPLLETIDEESEEEETAVKEVDHSDGQEASGVDVDHSEETAEYADFPIESA